MAYANSGCVGVDLTAVIAGTGTSSDEGNQFSLGTRVTDNNGVEYMYIHAATAIDQYDFVTVDENGECSTLGDAGGAAGHTLGAAQVAIANNEFGWVVIDAPMGNARGNIKASCAADTESLYTNTTAGHVDDATTADAILIVGVVAVTAAAGNDTNREIIMRSARFQS